MFRVQGLAMKSEGSRVDSFSNDTLVTRLGRMPSKHYGLVNVPIYRGSTIVAQSLEEWELRKTKQNPMANYGRFGSPLSRAFESAMAELEGGEHAILFPSGLSACTHALLAFVGVGDHVLISDSVYGPTRTFADQVLSRMGVTVEYFHPTVLDDLKGKIRSQTRVIYVESPGSLTFEVQDISAIAELGHRVGAFIVMDNTWATPVFFQPFNHGVDVSVHAATKYIIGHSDALLGVATANKRAWPQLQAVAHHFGEIAGPDDIFLALRGLRTLAVRMEKHWINGVKVAQALMNHSAVRRVMHPALECDPGYRLWRRDFKGASGLFGFLLQPMSRSQLSILFERLKLVSIGLSWGGFESLILLSDPPPIRNFRPSFASEPLLRIHIGLENANDLIDDLFQALDAATKPHHIIAN